MMMTIMVVLLVMLAEEKRRDGGTKSKAITDFKFRIDSKKMTTLIRSIKGVAESLQRSISTGFWISFFALLHFFSLVLLPCIYKYPSPPLPTQVGGDRHLHLLDGWLDACEVVAWRLMGGTLTVELVKSKRLIEQVAAAWRQSVANTARVTSCLDFDLTKSQKVGVSRDACLTAMRSGRNLPHSLNCIPKLCKW